MLKDTRMLEDYIVTMSNTVILGKQWAPQDGPEGLLRPTGLLMYTDRKEVRTVSYYHYCFYHLRVRLVTRSVTSVCLSVLFAALNYESIDIQTLEYVGHVHISRSSGQGQSHKSKNGT